MRDVMRNEYRLLMLSLAFGLSLMPISGHAQRIAADLYSEKIYIQDLHQQIPGGHTVRENSADLWRQNRFNVHIWDESFSSDSAVDTLSVTYSSHVGFLKRAAGITQYIISFNPLASGGKYSYLKDIFTFISLNTSLSSYSSIHDDFRNGTKLSELLNASYAFESIGNSRLTRTSSVSFTTNSEESARMTAYNDPTLKPFIHNPFHDSAISVYLPISLSLALTIAPAITYAFSTNNTNNQEYKGKGLVNNIIDKNSAIVYSGIHLKYSF